MTSVETLNAQVVELHNRIANQEGLLTQASNQHAEMQQRLALTESQNQRMATMMDEMRDKSEQAVRELHAKVEEARKEANGGRNGKQKLINNRDMKCTIFTGKEPYKPWAKRVKAYCNGLVGGFRQALEWAEKQTQAIDQTELNATDWQWISDANQELYDLLVMVTAEEALTIVELSANRGFEAWRTLFRRMDPVGEDYEFEAAESLMTRERCKDVVDLPAAIEKWQRDLNAYQERTGEKMPERWSVPVLFRMIPLKNYQEVKLRWRQDTEKNITKFMVSLMQWANDLKFEQKRQRGIKPMDVDTVAHETDENGYTLEDWNEYNKELEATIDWMGKGKKGRKGGGKGKGGKGACYWCNGDGHTKATCPKFIAWKKAKDEERKKKGLPPFQPRTRKGVDAVDAEGYDEVATQEEVGMLGFDFDCDALEESEEFECVRCDATCGSRCGCTAQEIEDWDVMGDALEMWEEDERRMIEERQRRTSPQEHQQVSIVNKFDALQSEDEIPVATLGAEEASPVKKSFLVKGIFNSPMSPSSTTSVADTFAREREELLEQLSANRATAAASTSPAPPPGIGTPVTPSTPPQVASRKSRRRTGKKTACRSSACSGCSDTESDEKQPVMQDAEAQTEVELVHRVAVTWIPVADALAPVFEHPETNISEEEDEPEDEIPDLVDDVNAVDSIFEQPGDREYHEMICQAIAKGREGAHLNAPFPGAHPVPWSQERMGIAKGVATELKLDSDLEEHIFGQPAGDGKSAAFLGPLAMVAGRMISMMLMALCAAAIANVATERQEVEDTDEFFRKLFEDESEEEQEVFHECIGGSDMEDLADIDVVGRTEDAVTRMKLKKGITMDSGAHHNVMPRRLARGKIRPSEGSRRGMNYVAANKGKIPNEGETDFEFTTAEGIKQSWPFQIAEVNKALGAVSDHDDNAFRVVFDKDMDTGIDCSYMLHKPSRTVVKMVRVNNVWIVEAIVDFKSNGDATFVRRG